MEDPHQGNNIAKICLGHRKEDLGDTKLFTPFNAYKNYKINIPLLASLLRIADELDITFERTPQLFYNNFDISDEKSKEEWKKHLSIGGVTTFHNNSLVQCNAICKDSEIHRALKKLEEKINTQLEDLPNHMHDYKELINELPRKFKMEIENHGYKDYNFKFSLENEYIFDLLVGEHLYSSKYDCIRELIKNSVDTCKFREKNSKIPFKPKITFELTQNNEKLIVTDNGMGMDEFSIEEYFTKIGKSFYRSEEFSNKKLDFEPLSELGIGFLSCFMIADNIIIDTKTDNSNPLKIEIDKKSDYFLVKDSDITFTGTKITLDLKEDIKENINLKKIIKKYARHLEYPLSIISPNNGEIEIKEQKFFPCPASVKQEKDEMKKYSGLKKINSIIKIENNEFQGYFCFNYGKDFDNMNDIIFKHNIDNNTLSNQGILVSNNLKLLPKYIAKICSFDINLKKNVLDLNVPRNDILNNNKYKKFSHEIEQVLIKEIKNLLTEIEQSMNVDTFFKSHDKKFCGISWKLNLVNSFFDEYKREFYHETSYINRDFPKNYLKLFFEFYSFICISNKGLSFVKANFLKNKKIIYIDFDFRTFIRREFLEEYLIDLFKHISLDEDYIHILEPNSNYILESFLDYEPQSFSEILIKKCGDNVNDIFAHDNENHIFMIDSDKCPDNRLILIYLHNAIFINANNKLIQFIINNMDDLTDNDKLLVKKLFGKTKNCSKIRENYKYVLDYFVSKKMISEENRSSYLLDNKEHDFCRNNYSWKNE